MKKHQIAKTAWALLAVVVLYLASEQVMKGGGYHGVYNYILMMTFIIVASGSKKIFWGVAFPIVIIFAIYAPIGFHYGPPNYQYFAAVLSTSTDGMEEFLGLIPLSHFFIGVYAIVGVLAYRWLCVKKSIKLYRNRTFMVALVVLALASQPPFLFFQKLYDSISKAGGEVVRLNHITEGNAWTVTKVDSKYDNYILLIGESVRRDYLHRYGYPVDDTPFMDKHGISVAGLFSAGATTVESLRLTLTLPNQQIHQPNYDKNIIGLANKAGFHTVWLSNQGYLGQYDTPVTYIAKWADVQQFTKIVAFDNVNIDDSVLLPLLKKNLNQSSAQKKFIVLHMFGSHSNVCQRIHNFRPRYISSNPKYTRLACYVTTIQKLDHFIKQVYLIAKQREKKTGETFAIVYFSDHGLKQDIRNDGKVYMMHGLHSLQDYQVPLYLITSDSKEKRDITRRISALNFTQGMAHLMGVKSPALNPNYAMFQPGADDAVRPSIHLNTLTNDPPIDITATLSKGR